MLRRDAVNICIANRPSTFGLIGGEEPVFVPPCLARRTHYRGLRFRHPDGGWTRGGFQGWDLGVGPISLLEGAITPARR